MQKFPKKLLIIKTSSLGDVIHCLPVVHDIRAHFPNVHIDWVVEENFADIPRMAGGVNQVFTVAMRRWKKQLLSKNTWAEIAKFKKIIQKNQYDVIIDTQGLLKSALITRQVLTTKNGVKHGYNKQSIREPIASWFYDKTYNISYQQHAVTRNRTLVAMSLGYATPTNAPDYGIEKHGISAKSDTSASRMAIGLQGVNLQDINLQGIDLQGINIKRDYIIALHGTSRASKLWPIENWVNLGKELAKQNISLALPWANDVEFARANAIAQQLQTAQVSNCIVSNCIVLPKLSIAQIASVISNAKAAIGVDTGLSHLAAALNIPTIAIYTDTNPALTGVLGGAFKPAINLGNIAEIPSVSDVLSTLKQIL